MNTLVELQGLETCFAIHEDWNVGGPNKLADAQSLVEHAGGAISLESNHLSTWRIPNPNVSSKLVYTNYLDSIFV